MFDPYRKWLGISAKDLPANHYRLLGLEVFEGDLDVIEGAAEKQMTFIRQYQSGEHAADAARILNELATARLCLLRPATKAGYDANLRQQIAATSATAATASESGLSFSEADLETQERSPRAGKKSKTKKAAGPSPIVLIGGGVGIAVCALIAFLSMGSRAPRVEKPTVENVTSSEVASPATETTAKPLVPATKPVALPSAAWSDPVVAAVPAGAPIDLLKTVDLDRDTFIGSWEKTGNALIGNQKSELYLPVQSYDDYQLTYQVRRLDGQDTLLLGFMMAGRQGMLVIDAWAGKFTGLYVDRREPTDNATTNRGPKFTDQSATIVLTVHPGHLHATMDGKTIVDWHGDPDRLYLHSYHTFGCHECPVIGTVLARYVFEKATLTPLKPEKVTPQPSSLASEVNVLELLDPDRDTARGLWSMNKGTLSSPENGYAQIYLPTVVPKEYTLSMTVEMPANHPGDALTVGLVRDQRMVQFVSTNAAAGLDTIDGRRWENNESRLNGPVLTPDKPVQFAFTVTKDAIRVDLDGRTMIDWRGDSRRLVMPDEWSLADGRRLYLGALRHFKFKDIKLGPPLPAPKIANTPALAIGKPIDLLPLIDVQRDSTRGTWERDGTALRCRGDAEFNALVLPVDVPGDYRLKMRVSRLDGGSLKKEGLLVNLPTENTKAEVVMDGHGSTSSGLKLDFLDFHQTEASRRSEPLIPPEGSHELEFTVHQDRVKVTKADAVILQWIGNQERLTVAGGGLQTPVRRIAIGSYHQSFRFERLELEALPPHRFSPVASSTDGQILPVLDVDRDSRLGKWTLTDGNLLSPKLTAARLRIPLSVPDRYTLSGEVTRVDGTNELILGLIVGGRPCEVLIDCLHGTLSAVTLLDRRDAGEAPNFTRRVYKTPLLPRGEAVKVQCQVTPDTIIVSCNDQEVIRWHGDARRLSQRSSCYPPNECDDDFTHLSLASWESVFQFKNLELRPMEPDAANDLEASFSGPFPTTPQADVPLIAAKVAVNAASSTTTPGGPMPTPASIKITEAKPGEWIDLLEWAEGLDWASRGINWNVYLSEKPTKSEIRFKSDNGMRFPLPAIIDGDYDMEVEFTRQIGSYDTALYFPVDGHPVRILLAYGGETATMAFENGKVIAVNPRGQFPNGERQRLQIRVRQEGDKASIAVDWNDQKDYFTWEGNPKSLYYREPGLWSVTMLQHAWIGAHTSQVAFHKVRVRMLSGTIRRDLITPEDREKDFKNGFVRLVGEEASAIKVGWARFTVNQTPWEVSPDHCWPLISRDFKPCDDFYGAHAPSRLKCNIPNGAKSFSVVGFNPTSHSAKFAVLIDGEEVHRSPETGIDIIKIDIPAKASLLELVADECGNGDYDHTHWCYPRYHAVAADRVTDKMLDGKSGTLKFTVTSGNAAAPVTHNQHIGPCRYIPVNFRDATLCDEFLYDHPPSTVTYQVPEGMTRFTAIGYCVWSSHVKFEVWADAKRIYESPQAGIIPIDVKLPAKTKTVELRVTDLGDGRADHALWCYPRLYRR
ncbi:MAG: hypothetical protein JWP89_5172 [Schlesneria sp.]|nr:hypothetical protein [Schlesneria sp.]